MCVRPHLCRLFCLSPYICCGWLWRKEFSSASGWKAQQTASEKGNQIYQVSDLQNVKTSQTASGAGKSRQTCTNLFCRKLIWLYVTFFQWHLSTFNNAFSKTEESLEIPPSSSSHWKARRATHHLDVQFAHGVVDVGQWLQEGKHERLAAAPAADQQPNLNPLFIGDAPQLSVNVGPVPAEGATRRQRLLETKHYCI